MTVLLISLIILNIFILFFFDKISILINLFDIPDDKRKIHSKKVSQIGGFIFLSNILFFLPYYLINKDSLNFEYFLTFKEIFIFYIFLFSFFLIGFFDDKFDLSSNIKLFLSFVLIYFLVFFDKQILIKELNFSFFNKNINIENISYLFSIMCFLLFINAFNMFDGINLQSTTYAFFLFLLFLVKGIFIEISLVLLISLLFFGYLNYKNKCFMGDNGTLLISFILSYFFVKSANVYKVFSADEIFLIMLVPGLDLIRLASVRIMNRKHPFKGDRNHIHHILLKAIGHFKTLLLLLSILIIPNVLSFIYGGTFYFIIIVIFIYFFLIIFFNSYNKE
jgi:UDP-GlcNAc:undecaprenyl-phosphate GlcNAc-1-phosphate transferase